MTKLGNFKRISSGPCQVDNVQFVQKDSSKFSFFIQKNKTIVHIFLLFTELLTRYLSKRNISLSVLSKISFRAGTKLNQALAKLRKRRLQVDKV